MGEGVTLVDGDGVGDAIADVEDEARRASGGVERKHSLKDKRYTEKYIGSFIKKRRRRKCTETWCKTESIERNHSLKDKSINERQWK